MDHLNNKVLYRDNPTGEPNTLQQDLDMNSKRILNLPVPLNPNEAARLADVTASIAGAKTATLTTFTPAGNVASTNVQAAIQELDTEKAVDTAVVHLAGIETVTGNKTFSGTNSFTGANSFSNSPTVPTAAVKDNTTKAASTAYVDRVAYGPSFGAYQSVGQAVSSSVFTKVTLDTEEFDTDNTFSSSRFQPTVAGYYQVNGTVRGVMASTELVCCLYKNGTLFKVGSDSSANNVAAHFSALVFLNGSTDYVELYVWAGAAITLGSGQSNTWFSGSLARPS